jgi:thiamine phosphate synthase YjbQ (UPF0047 family)
MPDLLDRPADLRQDVLAYRQALLPKESNHRTRHHIVQQRDGLGVIREVLVGQISHLPIV